METNFFGPLRLAQAFAPVLAANGGGALLNVLSVASWISRPQLAVYAASKTAAWSLTNGLRNELRPHGTQVLGLHMGFVDTDLTRGIDAPKSSADDIVRAALRRAGSRRRGSAGRRGHAAGEAAACRRSASKNRSDCSRSP
jgi:NAD(P)-dependent dehydrogenase (short-subunit alcohol dehydrogenase family)